MDLVPKMVWKQASKSRVCLVLVLRLNKLSLNASKTELIFFHSQRHKLDYDNITIKLNRRMKLKPVDFVKYLGMLIDKYLSWDFHINQLCKSLSRANGILS